MTLTNIAMLGILLGFVCLVVAFVMDGPDVESETPWNKSKKTYKKSKKHDVRVLHKRAA